MTQHKDEYWRKVRRVRSLLATSAPFDGGERFGCVALALQEALDSATLLRAGEILFEDYASVRLCVRAMMQVVCRSLG